MITEFDSIFHENGFIFVNENKKDIEAQMAARVDGQRYTSKLGHKSGKGVNRKLHNGSIGHGHYSGDKVGGADSSNLAVDNDTGKSTGISKQTFDRREAKRQEERAKRKKIASKVGQDNLNRILGEKKKKEKQAVNASALMESIELI